MENGWKEKILKAEREIGDGNIEMEQREREGSCKWSRVIRDFDDEASHAPL